MKTMHRLLVMSLMVGALGLMAGCHSWHHQDMAGQGSSPCPGCPKMTSQGAPCCAKPGMAMAATAQDQRADVLYTCNCGPECKCATLSKSPGSCACGKPLVWGHVIRVEGDEALLCTCAEGCQCAIDPKDPTKCGCGSPVKRVSLKGSGLFFCNCGGACSCNTVSNVPGECKCGMPLKQI